MRTDRSHFFSPAMWARCSGCPIGRRRDVTNFRSSLFRTQQSGCNQTVPYFPGAITSVLGLIRKECKPQPAVPSLLPLPPPPRPSRSALRLNLSTVGCANSSVDGCPMALGRVAHWLVSSKAGQQHHAHFSSTMLPIRRE
jgi:hypothetical protein